MAITITITIDFGQPAGREPDMESLGREIARTAGLRTRLTPAQYARIGQDFSDDFRAQVERWVDTPRAGLLN